MVNIFNIMVFLIIVIGGLTRLTDSGLSMVDWRPLLGTIPPLNQNQWLRFLMIISYLQNLYMLIKI